jgi:hypothetical protein
MSRQDIQRLPVSVLARIDLQNRELGTHCGVSECRKVVSALTIVVLSATAAVSGTVEPIPCPGSNISNSAIEQKDDGVVGVMRLPLPAPVGHRQPPFNEVSPKDQASIERDRWLDKGLDRKLRICSGC